MGFSKYANRGAFRMNETNLDKFKNTWEEEIKKIENEVIDNRGTWLIYNRFEIDTLHIIRSLNRQEFTSEVSLDMGLLKSKLTRALEIARTRYTLQNHSLWVKFTQSIASIFRGVPKASMLDSSQNI